MLSLFSVHTHVEEPVRVFSEQVGREVRKEALTGSTGTHCPESPVHVAATKRQTSGLRGGTITRHRCREMWCSRICPIFAS